MIADVFGFDPDHIDLAFYSAILVLSLEPIIWWTVQWRVMKPRPRLLRPELAKATAIFIAVGVMVWVSATLAWPMSQGNRLYWNPIARRVQGFALLLAVLSHYWWRFRREP